MGSPASHHPAARQTETVRRQAGRSRCRASSRSSWQRLTPHRQEAVALVVDRCLRHRRPVGDDPKRVYAAGACRFCAGRPSVRWPVRRLLAHQTVAIEFGTDGSSTRFAQTGELRRISMRSSARPGKWPGLSGSVALLGLPLPGRRSYGLRGQTSFWRARSPVVSTLAPLRSRSGAPLAAPT